MEHSPQIDIATHSAKLPGSLKAFIFRDTSLLEDDESVYAINWFNTRSAVVYDFYNWLAVRSVRKIGGEPFIKCKLERTLLDNDALRRDVLLIVKYPSLQNFRLMLESTIFQLVSLLRTAAVSNFTFGFTKRRDRGMNLPPHNPKSQTKDSIAVIQYLGEFDSGKLHSLLENHKDIELYYSGLIGGEIGTGKQSDGCNRVPCIISGIHVLKAEDAQSFDRLIENPDFQSLTQTPKQIYAGLYNRIL